MKTSPRFNLLSLIAALIATLLPAAMLMLSTQTSHAASASWLPSPPTNDWNTATNWTAGGPPNGPSDTATFAFSNTTGVSLSVSPYTEVNGVVFDSGASAFTITTTGFPLVISGTGITNNSGIAQNFTGQIYFSNGATAGSQTNFTNASGDHSGFSGTASAGNGTFTNFAFGANGNNGRLYFNDSSTAGNGTFINNGGAMAGSYGGWIFFSNSSTAGNGTFINNGAVASGAYGGGLIEFDDSSTAGNGTFINNGGTFSGAFGGAEMRFAPSSSAGNATLIANGGASGTNGGRIQLGAGSTSTARVEVFGDNTAPYYNNGNLDVSSSSTGARGDVMIGSIEGSGFVLIGGNSLTVGSNNLSTTFSGVIQDGTGGGTNGVLTKIGTGTLTFEGGVSNDHIRDGVTLSIAANSTIDLNFTGDPNTIRSLIVGGIGQLPGLYGSAASGAPYQLPQFAGTGKVLAKMLAVSRKTHGAAGDFDINLPFGGDPGIECRSGGVNGNYQVVVTFLNPVTLTSATVYPVDAGMVSSTTGNGTTVLTVNLTGMTNAQRVTVELANVNDGTTAETIPISIGMLIGDTNGDGVVNSGDSTQTKSRAGLPTDATNFRSDVNEDGTINSGDSFLVKSRAGTSLP